MQEQLPQLPFISNRAATPSGPGRSYPRGQQNRLAGGKSPSGKQGGKQSEHTHVTLEDVKGKVTDL